MPRWCSSSSPSSTTRIERALATCHTPPGTVSCEPGPSRRHVVTFGALALLASLLAGDTLSGRVADPDGRAVSGAAVVVVELHRVALTGTDGRFHFSDIPAGIYTVTVRSLGFAPLARRVTVSGSTTLDLTLERTSVWVEPVTVTATRAPLDVFSSPLPTEALSEDRLRRAQSVSLAHALAELPGINALSTGQQIGKPVIRGLAGPRVLVLEDGSRLEDYSWSDEDGPSVDARLAQRVEVIRGPASVLYGSDALRGAGRRGERRVGLAVVRDRPVGGQPPYTRRRARQHRVQRALGGSRRRHARGARQHHAALHAFRWRVQAARGRGTGER